MSTINIGIPIDLQKLLDTRMLVQAGSGGGKSYGLRKLIESIGNQVQQIVIDPEGEFVTLREKFDFALVSKGGDIPLNLKYAETLAHKILETGISVIIDLYELPQHERILFVKRFGQAMINAPKQLWHPCFIHIDEAHIFCPESSKSESTAAVIDLCTRGRKRGYCTVLATQRLPKLNKDATAECNNKMIGRSAQDIDRKRAGEELGMTTKADILSIRELEPGNFFAFGPAISNEVIKFKVAPVITTHLQSGKRMIAPPPTPKAIQKIITQLSDIPEEAERELASKQQMQQEIGRLKSELSKVSRPVAAVVSQQTLDKAVDQARKEVNTHYGSIVRQKDVEIQGLRNLIQSIHKTMQKISALSQGHTEAVVPPVPVTARPSTPKVSPIKQVNTPRPVGDGSLGKCSRSIICFLASMPDRGFTKAQIGIAIGYSPGSGGFNNSLAELNSRGFIVRGERLKVNESALPEIEAVTGGIDQLDYSIETFKEKLGKCEREIYEVLLDAPEMSFSKEQLAEKTPSQYSAGSGGFNNALARLNTLELIVRENGKVRLNPDLLELL